MEELIQRHPALTDSDLGPAAGWQSDPAGPQSATRALGDEPEAELALGPGPGPDRNLAAGPARAVSSVLHCDPAVSESSVPPHLGPALNSRSGPGQPEKLAAGDGDSDSHLRPGPAKLGAAATESFEAPGASESPLAVWKLLALAASESGPDPVSVAADKHPAGPGHRRGHVGHAGLPSPASPGPSHRRMPARGTPSRTGPGSMEILVAQAAQARRRPAAAGPQPGRQAWQPPPPAAVPVHSGPGRPARSFPSPSASPTDT